MQGGSQRRKYDTLSVKLPVSFAYATVDIETTGLDPESDIVVAMGLVYRDRLTVHVSRGVDIREDMASIVRRLMRETDVYAWNKGFEESFLGVTGLRELQLHPREKKDYSLSWGINIPVNGGLVPELWRRGRREMVALRAGYDALIEAVGMLRTVFLLDIQPVLLRFGTRR